MTEEELKNDWLIGNSVVAFVGALLLAQSWEMPEGTVKLLFIFTVPDYTGLVIFTIIAGLFVFSLFSALAAHGTSSVQSEVDPKIRTGG